MGDAGDFGADTEELLAAGVNVVKLQGVAQRILFGLHETLDRYPNPGGHGDQVAAAVAKNYVPGAEGALGLLHNVGELLAGNGGQAVDMGKVAADGDAAATEEANGFRRG